MERKEGKGKIFMVVGNVCEKEEREKRKMKEWRERERERVNGRDRRKRKKGGESKKIREQRNEGGRG